MDAIQARAMDSQIIGEQVRRIAALEAFLVAYDAWRAASDIANSTPDDTSYEEQLPLDEAEAIAEAMLIKMREDLRKPA